MSTDRFVHRDESPLATVLTGPLQGRRIALQPSISVREWPANAGSRALEGYIALENATIVDRLKDAGALFVGYTSMNEMGLGVGGDGAGQAIAEGEADLAMVIDIMGEARISAARAGLVGFKPSFGVLSRFGIIGLVPSMESVGIVAADVKDIMNLCAAVTGYDDRDVSLAPMLPDFPGAERETRTGVSVGVVSEAVALLDTAERESFKTALYRLEAAGCALHDISIEAFDLFSPVHNIVGSVEASSSAGKFDGVRYGHRAKAARDWNEMYLKSRGESFGLLLKTYLFQGAWFQFENYESFENACRIRSRLVSTIDGLYESVDFLALPTGKGTPSIDEATSLDRLYDLCRFTLPANVTGQPALNLPGGLMGAQSGLSVQLLGRRLDDARLLAWASRLLSDAAGENQ